MVNACVFGLGRIGLPLALILAKANHQVFGVDPNPRILYEIHNNSLGDTNARVERKLLKQFLGKRLFVAKEFHTALTKSEVVFIAIGTGIGSDGTPKLSNLFGLIEEICSNSGRVKEKLFVLKSTVPVGTTRIIADLMEKKTGLRCGEDFFLAFCPERVLGDKAISEMEFLPKVIGGMDKASSEKAARIYETIGGKIIIVDRPEGAELIKLMDNAYRQTLFAFANDFALLAEQFGINAYDLIKKANDSYPRNNIPLPSAGVSGYCLTKDPLYLEASFKEIASKRGFSSVWYWARKANDYMPIHVIDVLKRKLRSVSKNLKGANVLVCGIAYKENTSDIRNSHGLEIAERLREEGAKVYLWDPKVNESELGFPVVKDAAEILEHLDAMVFTVKHKEFEELNSDDAILRMIKKMRTPVILDGCAIFPGLVRHKDIYYVGVGIPK